MKRKKPTPKTPEPARAGLSPKQIAFFALMGANAGHMSAAIEIAISALSVPDADKPAAIPAVLKMLQETLDRHNAWTAALKKSTEQPHADDDA